MTYTLPASGVPAATPDTRFATAGIEALLQGSALFAQSVFQSQRLALQSLLAWQQAVAALQQDAWDSWVSHFAGGVPIDG